MDKIRGDSARKLECGHGSMHHNLMHQHAPIQIHGLLLDSDTKNISCTIESGSAVLLRGHSNIKKAIFCDLALGYIAPIEGKIYNPLKPRDVGFFGRNQATFGYSILDHLTFGIQDFSKKKVGALVDEIFSQRLKSLLDPESVLLLKENLLLSDCKLNERDFLEIAEVNMLLQNKQAIVIDTTTTFYQNAIELGFTHSQKFLRSQRTFFWLIDEVYFKTSEINFWDLQQKNKVTLYLD